MLRFDDDGAERGESQAAVEGGGGRQAGGRPRHCPHQRAPHQGDRRLLRRHHPDHRPPGHVGRGRQRVPLRHAPRHHPHRRHRAPQRGHDAGRPRGDQPGEVDRGEEGRPDAGAERHPDLRVAGQPAGVVPEPARRPGGHRLHVDLQSPQPVVQLQPDVRGILQGLLLQPFAGPGRGQAGRGIDHPRRGSKDYRGDRDSANARGNGDFPGRGARGDVRGPGRYP
ncbi:MAG: hypothetical protein A4E28_03009 [Methanocella sp. PtaU1.Bin125]|nr:MAG: hypothetical protein A4E28_03009 [Methanocella sp. PtaU1.Bin125]